MQLASPAAAAKLRLASLVARAATVFPPGASALTHRPGEAADPTLSSGTHLARHNAIFRPPPYHPINCSVTRTHVELPLPSNCRIFRAVDAVGRETAGLLACRLSELEPTI